MSDSAPTPKPVVLSEVVADMRLALAMAKYHPDLLDPDYEERIDVLSQRLEIAYAMVRWDGMYALANKETLSTISVKELADIREKVLILAESVMDRISPDGRFDDE